MWPFSSFADTNQNEDTGKDVFREMPVRLLGYANEVGEAFRPIVHRNVVLASYAIASGYCLADASHKALTSKKIPNNQNIHNESENTFYSNFHIQSGIDAIVWQSLASVVIPGITINRICWATLTLLKQSHLHATTKKWSAVIVSISCIPLIVKPIDTIVDKLLDNSLRYYLNKNT